MNYIIETNNLSKYYEKKLILDDINIHIPRGSIYGLVGKNGAGKTTLMRIICKLANQSDGKINYNFNDSNMGALIESPGIIRDFSAIENLKYFSYMFGLKNIDFSKILNDVGLDASSSKKASNFSLGMRQRLGIAICLMGNPEVLILDEPINGLDPEGVYQIRQLLQKINLEYNTTIIISSHIISELSKLATDYAIIDKGKLICEISKEQLENECKSYSYVTCNNNQIEDAKNLIINNFSQNIIIENNTIKIFDNIVIPELNKFLVLNNIDVLGIGNKNDNVEEFFVNKISGGTKNE